MSQPLLKNGRRLVGEQLVTCDILIEDGKVAAIGTDLHAGEGARVIDLENNLVTPGLVDIHVHLREPGYTNKETIATGSRAAAHGGFTTIAAMANLKPTCDTPERFHAQEARNAKDGAIKIIQYSPVTTDRAGKEPVDVAAQYVAGARLFSDDGAGIQDASVVYRAMQQLVKYDLPLCDHAQDNQLANGGVINDGPVPRNLARRGFPRSFRRHNFH